MPVELLVGLSSDVSDALFERYRSLAARLGGDRVLALVSAAPRREWMGRLRESGVPRAEDRVFTPGSWVRRELDIWWPLAESGLAADGWLRPPEVEAEPLFVQADLAQEFMAASTQAYRVRTGAFETARTPAALQHVHLVDTLGRAIDQDLELEDACHRLVLGAGTPDQAAERQHMLPCLHTYRDTALRHRVLDTGLAWWVFGRYLAGSPEFQAYVRREIRALLVAGLDDAPPLLRRIVRSAGAGAESVALGWSLDGGLRSPVGGGVEPVLAEWPGAVRVEIAPGRASAAAAGARLAAGVREALGGAARSAATSAEPFDAPGSAGVPPAATGVLPAAQARPGARFVVGFSSPSRARFSWGRQDAGAPRPKAEAFAEEAGEARLSLVESATYPEMLERAVADALAARQAGLSVAVVLPQVTQLHLWWLRRAFAARGIPTIISAGTNRLVDYRPVRVALALASLAFPQAGTEALDRDTWTDVLEEITGADAYVVGGLADCLAADPAAVLDSPGRAGPSESGWWPAGQAAEASPAGEDAPTGEVAPAGEVALVRLRSWLREVRGDPVSLPGVFRLAFARLLAPHAGDFEGPGEAAAWERADQVNQLIATAERFEALDRRLQGRWGERSAAPGLAGLVGRFRDFLLAGSFAERPMAIRPALEGAIEVGTASRIAQGDNLADVQVWLDVSSPAWLKSADRELTNWRVLVAERDLGPYGPAERQADAADSLARTLLACAALTRREVRCHGSLLDAEGREQPGGLADVVAEAAEAHPAAPFEVSR